MLTFKRTNNGLIGISKFAAETMLGFRQLSDSSKEAGGMLLGRLILETRDIVVDQISTPSLLDKRSRFSFFRGKQLAQKVVDELWAASNQTCVYLGEWHTHPENDPSPSGIDLINWKKIVRKARYEQDDLLFVIVGRKKIRIWELNKKTGLLTLCIESERID